MILILRFYGACCLDMDMIKLTSKTKEPSYSGILVVLGGRGGGGWRRVEETETLREWKGGRETDVRNATTYAA